jgi:1-acyl-sn-glycerol-3-phosphate acyltransferase
MFPEGKRSPNAQLQSPQPGTSLLAARSGVPLLPVGITGSEQVKGIGFIRHRPKITVTIGCPFLLPSAGGKLTRFRLAQLSDSIMEHIAELLPESYQGAYGLRSSLRSDNGD